MRTRPGYGHNVGTYATLAELIEENPQSGIPGNYGFVGLAAPFLQYEFDGLQWVTGGELSVPYFSIEGALTTVDSIQFDTAVSVLPVVEGQLAWNSEDGTLNLGMNGGSIQLQVGQENLIKGLNRTGTTLLNGKVVRISGAQGNRLTIDLASAVSLSLSSSTIGILTEDVLDNQQGFLTTFGLVRGINTAAFAEGSRVYLSTVAGELTATAPSGPNSAVAVGYIVRSHATVGSIFVDVEAGLAVDSLDDVVVSNVTHDDTLHYDVSTTTWMNRPLGFSAGSGGTVTQLVSRTNPVTLDKSCGNITLFSAAGTTTATSFTVNNTKVGINDVVNICQKSGTNLYQVFVTNVAAGSFRVTFLTTGGVAVDAPTFNFVLVKSAIV